MQFLQLIKVKNPLKWISKHSIKEMKSRLFIYLLTNKFAAFYSLAIQIFKKVKPTFLLIFIINCLFQ